MGPWLTLLLLVLAPLALIGLLALFRVRGSAPHRIAPADAPAGLAEREFLDAVAHDLRSPLSAILGYQELLCDGFYGPLDPAALEPVRRIGSSALHLEQILAGIGEFVRDQGLAPDLRVRDLDPGPAIAEAMRRVAPLAAERGVTLRSPPSSSCPPSTPTPAASTTPSSSPWRSPSATRQPRPSRSPPAPRPRGSASTSREPASPPTRSSPRASETSHGARPTTAALPPSPSASCRP